MHVGVGSCFLSWSSCGHAYCNNLHSLQQNGFLTFIAKTRSRQTSCVVVVFLVARRPRQFGDGDLENVVFS